MVNKYKMFDEELYNKLGKFLVGMKDDAEILLVYNTEKTRRCSQVIYKLLWSHNFILL